MFEYVPSYIANADKLFSELVDVIEWAPRRPAPFGHITPRDECWYHDDGTPYRFGTVAREACIVWPAALLTLQRRLSDELGQAFNSVLCNMYRDGSDSVAWHSDDEPELGATPTIASLSLGATRLFKTRRKADRSDRRVWAVSSGDLLIMRGDCQREWEHSIPKTRQSCGPRINLTFRVFNGKIR